MSPDEPKRYVIDGKTYELPDSKLDEYGRLKNEFHELIMSTECLPIPKGCLSNRSNEPLRKGENTEPNSEILSLRLMSNTHVVRCTHGNRPL